MYPQSRTPISVSELNEYTRRLLAGDPLLRDLEVTGEISGYKHHYKGHRYFTLKDDGARVQCAFFANHAAGLQFEPRDGMRVTVRASASVYPRDGVYQLYVTRMRQEGKGDIHEQLERLKRKLQAEGLFDPARKREIPRYPRVIGVVSSRDAAGWKDIVNIARRRNPSVGILLSPSAVQGVGAAEEIARAIERLSRHGGCDVMLVGRGGGSKEDLDVFNEEVVARAIAASSIPVISCVGHQIDYTVADYVADLRMATPSAAAEIAVPELTEMRALLNNAIGKLARALKGAQQVRRLRLEKLCAASAMVRPARVIIDPARTALSVLERRARLAMPMSVERARHRLSALEASLRALDPDAVLDRGYAVVRQADRIIDGIGAVDASRPIQVRFADGEIEADVRSISKKDGSI